MKKILIAVDDTKGSKNVLSVFQSFVQLPVEVVLLHVERLEGRSMMIDMIGDAELSTLKDMLHGTEYKDALDRRSDRIVEYFKSELSRDSRVTIKTIRRDGIPTDEILKVASEESVDMIILGQSGRRGFDRFITGRVAEHVEKRATVPVLVAKRPLMCEEPYTTKDAWAAVSVTSAVVAVMFFIGVLLQRSSIFP